MVMRSFDQLDGVSSDADFLLMRAHRKRRGPSRCMWPPSRRTRGVGSCEKLEEHGKARVFCWALVVAISICVFERRAVTSYVAYLILLFYGRMLVALFDSILTYYIFIKLNRMQQNKHPTISTIKENSLIFKLKRDQTFTLQVEVQADTTTITSYLRLGVDHSHQRLPSIRWTRRRCKPPSCATYGFSCEAEG